MAVLEGEAAAVDERRLRKFGARQVEVETMQFVEHGLRGALVAGVAGKRQREEAVAAFDIDVDPLGRLAGDQRPRLHEAQRIGGLAVWCA